MPTPTHRRPYHHTADSDSDDVSEIDEEHQEALISSFAASDAQKSSLYQRIFLAIVLCATLPSLFTIFSVSSAAGARERGLALMCASSLVCSAWTLWALPLGGQSSSSTDGALGARVRGTIFSRDATASLSPIEKYLPLLNGALAGLLCAAGLVAVRRDGRGGRAEQEVWKLIVPGAIYLLVLFVRQHLAPLNLEDLQRARYEYKGA